MLTLTDLLNFLENFLGKIPDKRKRDAVAQDSTASAKIAKLLEQIQGVTTKCKSILTPENKHPLYEQASNRCKEHLRRGNSLARGNYNRQKAGYPMIPFNEQFNTRKRVYLSDARGGNTPKDITPIRTPLAVSELPKTTIAKSALNEKNKSVGYYGMLPTQIHIETNRGIFSSGLTQANRGEPHYTSRFPDPNLNDDSPLGKDVGYLNLDYKDTERERYQGSLLGVIHSNLTQTETTYGITKAYPVGPNTPMIDPEYNMQIQSIQNIDSLYLQANQLQRSWETTTSTYTAPHRVLLYKITTVSQQTAYMLVVEKSIQSNERKLECFPIVPLRRYKDYKIDPATATEPVLEQVLQEDAKKSGLQFSLNKNLLLSSTPLSFDTAVYTACKYGICR